MRICRKCRTSNLILSVFIIQSSKIWEGFHMFTPDELSAYATCIAAVAALLSAVAAFKANS
ncbi:hypothetical protein CGK56_25680, partial [Vibrio parahaemolyticus]